jgi:ABC-type nitrate/sulfonate/bicarbonate transport system substrate-binding protein
MLRQAGSSLLAPTLAVAVLVAVGASHRLEAQPRFPRIIVGVGPDVGFTEFVVGVKEGVFARQGNNASLQLFAAGPATLEAVSAGNADVGSSSQFVQRHAAEGRALQDHFADLHLGQNAVCRRQSRHSHARRFDESPLPEIAYLSR